MRSRVFVLFESTSYHRLLLPQTLSAASIMMLLLAIWAYCYQSLRDVSAFAAGRRLVKSGHSFPIPRRDYLHRSHRIKRNSSRIHVLHMIPLDPQSSTDASEKALALWMLAFSSSHIGMSAIRTSIISSMGEFADAQNLVDNEGWTLPEWWPGDGTSGNRIFPDVFTAGRQLYRALYTAVSFVTLGSAFAAYLHASSSGESIRAIPESSLYNACLLTAALSLGAAIASLFNASPLGLMPGFERIVNEQGDGDTVIGNAIAVSIQRNDTQKFTPRGLTRVTRHPLILPVVPWGFSTAYLSGGRACDCIFFCGLSIYAIAGCFAQDLRVIREEGSVGTVFQAETQGEMGERSQLNMFFEETSFIPFKAVLDGRQSLNDIYKETPWLQLAAGLLAGIFIEQNILQLLQEWSVAA